MGASAVLFSGGLDSTVLLARELAESSTVLPVHVRSGLSWEGTEARAIARILGAAPFLNRALPLVSLSVDMRDVYPADHWAITGRAPGYDAPDNEVYLEGRNLTLTTKAAVLCARRQIDRLVLGPLAGNPFPDATAEFFEAMSRALSLGLNWAIEIAAPFAKFDKAEVIAVGVSLGVPMDTTMSCMMPAHDTHCGNCNKCRERREAFARAGVPDRTRYHRL